MSKFSSSVNGTATRFGHSGKKSSSTTTTEGRRLFGSFGIASPRQSARTMSSGKKGPADQEPWTPPASSKSPCAEGLEATWRATRALSLRIRSRRALFAPVSSRSRMTWLRGILRAVASCSRSVRYRSSRRIERGSAMIHFTYSERRYSCTKQPSWKDRMRRAVFRPGPSMAPPGATPAGWREAQTESLHLYMEKEKTCNDLASILGR